VNRYIIPSEEEIRFSLEKRHTKAVQDKLYNAKVAVCGLGGLGSNIAISLARTGIGSLHLIDFDRVDLSNLNRQQYKLNQINQPKPEALKNSILEFAPYCQIKTDFIKLNEENIPSLLSLDTYICEAFDRPEQKAMLTNTVLEKLPEKYLVGASGMIGYGSNHLMKTRKIMAHYYLCGDGLAEGDGLGLMAPRVMLCAAQQANTIIRLIMEKYEV
jgi:sulfur carrier protein ThiS adenylyltransferase